MNKAARQYTIEFLLAMTGYVILMLASVFLLRESQPTALRIFLAAMPVLPLLFGFRAYVRYLARLDELQQRIQMMAHAWAAGITGMLTFTYGLLTENAGLPAISLIWVFPLLVATWGIATGLLSRRYQ
jgi:hypothetical protein